MAAYIALLRKEPGSDYSVGFPEPTRTTPMRLRCLSMSRCGLRRCG